MGWARRERQVRCSRQLLFLCVLRPGVYSAPVGQWAARKFLKSSWFERRAPEAAEVADGLRVLISSGVSVTQNESGARTESRWWRSGPLVALGGAHAGVVRYDACRFDVGTVSEVRSER